MRIASSGLHSDGLGNTMLVTQGLSGYTLVANKKILFRLFVDLTGVESVSVVAIITHRAWGLKIRKVIAVPCDQVIVERTGPHGPSVGVIFSGAVFPVPSPPFRCEVQFAVVGLGPLPRLFMISDLEMRMPGRLRLLIHNLVGTAPWGTNIQPDFSWLINMFHSLERFSAMLPVSDGLKFGLTHDDAGLCFVYGQNIEAWPQTCPSGVGPPCPQADILDLNLAETRAINASGTIERVDATVSWRPFDPLFPAANGEGVGGAAFFLDVPPGTGLAAVVGGVRGGRDHTAGIMAQEVGHLFGLEPPESPHFDGDAHSKDQVLSDPFAFDFYLLKPYAPPPNQALGDVMSGGWGQGRDLVLYNAFDWEFLRNRLAALWASSTRMGSLRRPSAKQRKALVSSLRARFDNEASVDVRRPQTSLTRDRGNVWQWTCSGFQSVRATRTTRVKSGLGASAEGFLECLADLGVDEVHAPIGGRPLSVVVNPEGRRSLHSSEFHAFEFAKPEPVRPRKRKRPARDRT
jgi:hypothetical protein